MVIASSTIIQKAKVCLNLLSHGREIRQICFSQTPDNYMIVIPKGWTKKQVGEEVEESEALNWCLKNYPGIFEYLMQA